MKILKLTVLSLLSVFYLSMAAFAEDVSPFPTWMQRLDDTPLPLTADMLHTENGTSFELYTAPYSTAQKLEGAQVTIGTDTGVLLLGHVRDGEWLWIKYTAADGQSHIGWIHAQLYGIEMDSIRLGFYTCRLTKSLILLEEPDTDHILCELSAGTEIAVLDSYPGTDGRLGWEHVEVILDGQPLWGFLPSDSLEEIPAWHIENKTLYVHEGITILGDLSIGWTDNDTNSEASHVSSIVYADFFPGDMCCSSLSTFMDFNESDVDTIVLPESLRVIGGMAMDRFSIKELRLPGSVQYVGGIECIYAMDIGHFILASGYTCDLPGMDYTTVGAFEVESGNPRYSSRDGVLFSADQKTLILYPNGSPAEHYDVPRGTECIGFAAFSFDDQDIPIRTLSLPIGLKEINDYAFASLGNLVSIVIPPTVTRLADTAFSACVSLERISMPEGFSIKLSKWAEQGDFTYYNGDNHSTVSEDDQDPASLQHISETANLISDDRSPIPLYLNESDTHPIRTLPFGTRVYTNRVANGRCEIYIDNYRERSWVELTNLLFLCEDTYFSLTDADFAADQWYDEITGIPLKREMFDTVYLGVEIDRVCFSTYYIDDNDEEIEISLDLHLNEVTLYRSGPDDNRWLGYLDAGEMEEAVEVLDAPDGSVIGFQFPYTQAEVLAEDHDWLKVHTPQYDGWVRRDQLITVYPKEN